MNSVFEAQGYSIDINAVKDQLRLLGHEVRDDVIMKFIKEVYLPQRIAQSQQPQHSAVMDTEHTSYAEHEATRDSRSEHSTRSSQSTAGKLQRPPADNLALADAIEIEDNVVLSDDDEFNFVDDANPADAGIPKRMTPGQRPSSSKHTPIELRGDSASDWNDDFGLNSLKISAQGKLLNQQTVHSNTQYGSTAMSSAARLDTGIQDTSAPQHTSHTILPDTATTRDRNSSLRTTHVEPYSPSARDAYTAPRGPLSTTAASSHLTSTHSQITHHHNTSANIAPPHQPERSAIQLTAPKPPTTNTGTTMAAGSRHTAATMQPRTGSPSSSVLHDFTTKPVAPASTLSSPFLSGHPDPLRQRTRPTYAPAAPEPEPSLSNYSVRSTSSRSSTLSSASSSAKKKVDRVSRYHQLAAGWEKDRFLKRNAGRSKQAINFHTYFASVHAVENERQQQRKQAVRAQTKKALEPASSYQVPTEKRRDSLRWEVRTQMRRTVDA